RHLRGRHLSGVSGVRRRVPVSGGALPPDGAALSGGRPGGRLDRRQAVRQSLRQVAQVALRRFSVLR
ncbi:50S ribosomal protein L35, partial [Dysosmobacter welbionis]